jgi:hypothetical protein
MGCGPPEPLKHLLVSDGDRLDGSVCLCELIAGRGGGTVADRMNDRPWVISHAAALADVTRLMRCEESDFVLVVEDDEVVGLVTDGDLYAAGVPEMILPRRVCLACRTTANVCRHPRNRGMDFCLDCLQRAVLPESETGEGD